MQENPNTNPTVLIVRHGITEMNDPANERVRGYSDVPLSFEGKMGVLETGNFLFEQKFNIAHMISSPLQRAMMTASLISAGNAEIKPDNRLLPWNLGRLMGQPVKEVAEEMNYLQAYPMIKAPEGESYQDFYTRWSEGLDSLKKFAEAHPDEAVVGVVHSRNLLALPSILGNKDIGDVPIKGGPAPASVTAVTKDGDDWSFKLLWNQK